mmetsp:Transcript_12562/g.35584  ORF Transcript_12562/g.35584 Transcript_12562/m.35584 type:complete len:324 (+) Transcript_12562:3-974(+)
MGFWRRLRVHYDVPSPADPAVNSIVSGELDAFFDFEGLWHELVRLCRDPVDFQSYRRSELTEISESEHHVLLVQDATAYGGLKSEEVVTKLKYHLSKEKGEVRVSQVRDHEVKVVQVILVHQSPLRVETWNEKPLRFSGDPQGIVHGTIYSIVGIRKALGGRVPHFDIDSDVPAVGTEDAKSILTSPLDGLGSRDDILVAFAGFWEHQGKVVERTSTGFTYLSKGTDGDRSNWTWVRVNFDYPAYSIDGQTFDSQRNCTVKFWFRVHKDPLRIEWWGEPGHGNLERSIDDGACQQLRRGLKLMKARASSGSRCCGCPRREKTD